VDARGVTGFNSPEFSLDRGLVLPDFNEPGKRSWPPHEVPLGALLAEQMKPRSVSAMSSCPTKTSSTSSASVARIDTFHPGSRSHSTQLSSRVQSWAVATNDFTRPDGRAGLGGTRGIRVRAKEQAASAKATGAIG
jgi:hypothetical protein